MGSWLPTQRGRAVWSSKVDGRRMHVSGTKYEHDWSGDCGRSPGRVARIVRQRTAGQMGMTCKRNSSVSHLGMKSMSLKNNTVLNSTRGVAGHGKGKRDESRRVSKGW